MRGWSFHQSRPQVCDHRVELGTLPRGTLHVSCMLSVGVFSPIRGKLNVIIHGTKTHSSHYLSPLFTFKEDYEPFLYVFKTRLATLRAMTLSFDPELASLWMKYQDVPLNECPTKILGPFGCFIWSCQVLGWKVTEPLEITIQDGTTLHLLLTPVKAWHVYAYQAWVDWVLQKAKIPEGLRSISVSYLSYHNLWSHHKMADYPLSQKFRTLGILSGSAKAQINGLEHTRCEFCSAQEAGHEHVVLRCEKTASLRNSPKYLPLRYASVFTRCAGIPTMTGALPRPSVGYYSLGLRTRSLHVLTARRTPRTSRMSASLHGQQW